MTQAPDGLGFFYKAKDMLAPEKSAELAIRAGATHCYVLTWSVEGTHQPVHRVIEACKALAARNIVPLLYFFPVDDDVAAAEAHLDACSAATGIKRICADIEPFREKDDIRTPVDESEFHDWDAQEISSLFARLRAKGYDVSISVFPRKQWKALDWEEILGPGTEVLLQVYKTVEDTVKLAREVSFWKQAGMKVVCCVGSYLGGASLFRRDLERVKDAGSLARVEVWALGTTSDAEADEARAFVVDAWRAP